MLASNTDSTAFMHQGFHMDDGSNPTRPSLAWLNSAFGEMIGCTFDNYPEMLRESEP
jgi:meiotically up-regulated gene 157 (Mug157) protein